MARASKMFDVILSPKEDGERELAAFHFLKLQPNDPMLLGTDYPAHWVFQGILSLESQFCTRISYKRWKIVHKFYKSGKAEKIVRIHPTAQSKQKCVKMGGETEILITSLTDMEAFPKELFSDLYHLRWPVEEDYKTLKYRIQIENFSEKSVHSVYQDFHAKIVSKNFTAVIANTTRDQIIKKSENLKYRHQINFAQALSKMKNTIVLLFNCTRNLIISSIEQIRTIFIQTTESIRPNRQYPRKHRVKQKRFDFEYKTVC